MKRTFNMALLTASLILCSRIPNTAQVLPKNAPPRRPAPVTQTATPTQSRQSGGAPGTGKQTGATTNAQSKTGTKVVNAQGALPDLVITKVEKCQYASAFGSSVPSDVCSGKDGGYRVNVKNQGAGGTRGALLEVTYQVSHMSGMTPGGIHLSKDGALTTSNSTPPAGSIKAKTVTSVVPALMPGKAAWVFIPDPEPGIGHSASDGWGISPGAPGGPTTTLLSFTAVIDPHNEIAESDESNNKFIKPLEGNGSEAFCDLRLAKGSKVFVVGDMIYANIIVVNYGTKGTCAGIKVPTMRIDFDSSSPSNNIGSTPPWFVGKQLNSVPKDWGSVLNTFQFSCNELCRKHCLNSEGNSCAATVLIFGYDPPVFLNGSKENGYVLGRLFFNEQYKGDVN